MADSIAARVAELADLTLGPRAYFDVIALGPPALPELERLARAAASTVYQPRVLAVDAVSQIGGTAATEVLLRALADSVTRSLDPVLRQAEDIIGDRICAQLGAGPDEPRVRDALVAILDTHPYPGSHGRSVSVTKGERRGHSRDGSQTTRCAGRRPTRYECSAQTRCQRRRARS